MCKREGRNATKLKKMNLWIIWIFKGDKEHGQENVDVQESVTVPKISFTSNSYTGYTRFRIFWGPIHWLIAIFPINIMGVSLLHLSVYGFIYSLRWLQYVTVHEVTHCTNSTTRIHASWLTNPGTVLNLVATPLGWSPGFEQMGLRTARRHGLGIN